MEITINDVGPSQKVIKVTIPEDEIKKQYKEKMAELASSAQIKGFRPGHIPQNVLDRRFGKAVLEEMKTIFIAKCFEEVMKTHSFNLMGEPELNEEKSVIEKDKAFSFEIVLRTQPEFKVPEYKGIEVKKPAVRVNNKDVDVEIANLRKRKGEFIVVENPIVEEGDLLICNMNLTVDDKMVLGKENLALEADDTEIMGIAVGKKLFIGHKTGDICEKKVTLPQEFPIEEYRAKSGQISFAIVEIKRAKLPELTDDFAREVGYKDIPDLKAQIRELIKNQKEAAVNTLLQSEILKKLLETEIELPQDFINERVTQELQKYREDMLKEGKSSEKIEEQIKKQEEKVKQRIVNSLKEYLIINKIAHQEKIEATDEDVDAYVNLMAQQERKWPSEIKREFEERGIIDELKFQVKLHKVLSYIRENAKIV